MKKLPLLFIIGITGALPSVSQAVFFDSVIYDMPSEKKFISRRVYNDSKDEKIYIISAAKVDRPGENEKSFPVSPSELIYGPLRFTLEPGKSEYFKIFYTGPQDDQERYYRLSYREVSMTSFLKQKDNKEIVMIPDVKMSTLLVVRPRKMNFRFSIDEKSNTLINNGNTYFRVVTMDGCFSREIKDSQFYVLPHQVVTRRELNESNKKFIVAFGRYIHLGEGCFSNQH
ncbi:hypothetical protein GCM10022405_46780 [Gibbsiella dentisursi]|uniref:Molecular chaperone n=1 Tax=Gibbsiella dentisursi TaxID=796890 RepID=A0ABP7M7T6_9GAMM